MANEVADDTQDEFESLLSGSGLVFAGTVTSKVLYFFAFVTVIRALDVPSYGQLALALTVFQVVTTFSLFGLNNSLQHFLPKVDGEGAKRQLIQLAIIATGALSIAAGVICFVFADNLATFVFQASGATPIFRIIAITIPVAVTFRISMSIMRALEQVRPHVYLENLLAPLIRFLFVILVALAGFGAPGMATAYLAGYIVVLIFALLLVYRNLQRLSTTGSRETSLKELFVFSAPLLGVGVINMFAGQIDTFLLGILSDPYDVGIFRAIFTLSQNFLVVFSSLQFLFMPMFSRLVSEGSSGTQDFYERATRWGFYITIGILMFVFLFAEPLLSVLFKPEYRIAADELRLFTFSSAVAAFAGFNSQALLGFGYSRIHLFGSATLGIVNFIVDLALIPVYGVLGAVIGTVAATVTTQLVFSIKLYRNEGIHPLSKRTVVPAGYACASALGLLLTNISLMTVFMRLSVFVLFALTFVGVVVAVDGIEDRDVRAGYKGLRTLTQRLHPGCSR